MIFYKAKITKIITFFPIALLIMVIYGFLFPAINWPDEYRNIGLLQEGNDAGYSLIYGHFTNAVLDVSRQFVDVGNIIDSRRSVSENRNFKMIDGGLRYLTVSAVPVVYYTAKLSNILLVCIFSCAVFLFLTSSNSEIKHEATKIDVYLLSLAYPGVAYGIMQISTDILFNLCCLIPFFINSRRNSIGFAVVTCLLALEDRGFLILTLFIFLKEFLTHIGHRTIRLRNPGSRVWNIFLWVTAAVIAASLIESALLEGTLLNMIYPGLGSTVSAALTYTHTKSFDTITSLVVFYAGLIIMPGATELFVRFLPLYFISTLIVIIIGRSLLYQTNSYASDRAYIALLSTLIIFFFITQAVHVFESGRYYFFFVPYALDVFLRGGNVARKKIFLWGVFFGTSVFSVTTAQFGNI